MQLLNKFYKILIFLCLCVSSNRIYPAKGPSSVNSSTDSAAVALALMTYQKQQAYNPQSLLLGQTNSSSAIHSSTPDLLSSIGSSTATVTANINHAMDLLLLRDDTQLLAEKIAIATEEGQNKIKAKLVSLTTELVNKSIENTSIEIEIDLEQLKNLDFMETYEATRLLEAERSLSLLESTYGIAIGSVFGLEELPRDLIPEPILFARKHVADCSLALLRTRLNKDFIKQSISLKKRSILTKNQDIVQNTIQKISQEILEKHNNNTASAHEIIAAELSEYARKELFLQKEIERLDKELSQLLLTAQDQAKKNDSIIGALKFWQKSTNNSKIDSALA